MRRTFQGEVTMSLASSKNHKKVSVAGERGDQKAGRDYRAVRVMKRSVNFI